MRAVMNTTIVIRAWQIPVKVYTVTGDTEDTGLHWVHRVCKSRLQQQLRCPTCVVTPPEGEMVRAAILNAPDTRTVLIEQKELDQLNPAQDKVMPVAFFAHRRDINPEWISQTHALIPADDTAYRPYKLLYNQLQRDGLVAITRMTPRTRTRVAVIVPGPSLLHVWSLFYAETVRQIPTLDVRPEPSPAEHQHAHRLMKEMTGQFVHGDFRDEMLVRLGELVQAKLAGKEHKVPVFTVEPAAAGLSLMSALQESITIHKGRKKKITR